MSKFSQREVERIMRAAIKTGMTVGHYEVRPDGTVAVYAQGEAPKPVDGLETELQQFRKSNGYN